MMHIGKYLVINTLVSCYLWSILTASSTASETTLPSQITIGVLKDNQPFIYQEDGKWHGSSAEGYQAVFEQLMIEVKFIGFDNFPRIFSHLSQGLIDATINLRLEDGQLKSNKLVTCTSNYLARDIWGAHVLRDSSLTGIKDKADLKQLDIASLRIIDTAHLPSISPKKLLLVRNIQQLPRLLLSGRVDAVIASNMITKSWAAQGSIDTKEIYSFGYFYAHLCFSHQALGPSVANNLKTELDKVLPPK